MSKGALFIGWGEVFPGYRKRGLTVFEESVAYWTGKQKSGEIDSVEAVFLDAHGGDLTGFLVIKGDREKLSAIRLSNEYNDLNAKAALVVANLGAVEAFVGDENERRTAVYRTLLADYD